jgi:hypothetical protein
MESVRAEFSLSCKRAVVIIGPRCKYRSSSLPAEGLGRSIDPACTVPSLGHSNVHSRLHVAVTVAATFGRELG